MKIFFTILLLHTIVFNSEGQPSTQGPLEPTVVNVQYAGCLSCKGTEWFNPVYTGQFDSVFTEASLMEYGFCFQTSCYYARGLMPRDYGFSIPANAVILGIRSEVLRMAGTGNCIVDTIIQLYSNGSVKGLNKADPNFWPDSPFWISYGDSSDLWGANWTPADVNTTDFGLLFTPMNRSAASYIVVAVDVIRITVWYQIGTGMPEQVTASLLNNVYYNPQEKYLSIKQLKMNSSASLEIFSETGQVVASEKISLAKEIKIPVNLKQGKYLVRIISLGESFTGKFVVVGN